VSGAAGKWPVSGFCGCRFVNADLRYKGTAPFELRSNVFDGYLNLEFAPNGVDASAMAVELDRAFHDIGYDLGLLKQIANTREPVWRFHTLLPCRPERAAASKRRQRGCE
jgi:hypothetical protein